MSAVFRNQILSALLPEEADQLAPSLEKVRLSVGQVLERPGIAVEHVYFPESGVASVVAIGRDGREVEAGPFGRDGMSGLAVVSQAECPATKTLVQIEGEGYRVSAAAFLQLLDWSATARRLFLRYSYAFALQSAHTALAASVGLVEQRLARWLLMLHDRIDGDELSLTHDLMAFMLAVRRPGVTVALHMLEGKALIRSTRGRVVIRDRDGLEELCGPIYGVPETEYRRLIPRPARPE